ncbi:MAG: hypothetical protein LLG04_08890 [Parachlamydia sp.]|nr:hypothetical protein [Parachlamydia sp.]
MVTPAGPQPLPGEPHKKEPGKAPGKTKLEGHKPQAAQVGKEAIPKGEQEAKKVIGKKVTWQEKGIGKEIGSIWHRIAGKVPSEQQALREETAAKKRSARMERLEDLSGKDDPLAIDLVKECKSGKINADQAVIILGTIQQHNEKIEGIISHPLTPRDKEDSYGQLFTELKKLSKNPQTQSAIDALIRKHSMK